MGRGGGIIRFDVVCQPDELIEVLNQHRINTPDKENIICSVFGCGRSLTMREKLFGNKCIHCLNEKTNEPENT